MRRVRIDSKQLGRTNRWPNAVQQVVGAQRRQKKNHRLRSLPTGEILKATQTQKLVILIVVYSFKLGKIALLLYSCGRLVIDDNEFSRNRICYSVAACQAPIIISFRSFSQRGFHNEVQPIGSCNYLLIFSAPDTRYLRQGIELLPQDKLIINICDDFQTICYSLQTTYKSASSRVDSINNHQHLIRTRNLSWIRGFGD